MEWVEWPLGGKGAIWSHGVKTRTPIWTDRTKERIVDMERETSPVPYVHMLLLNTLPLFLVISIR